MPIAMPRSISWLLGLLLIGGGFLSCQQSRPTEPNNSGPFVVYQTWPMDSIRMPDSVSWLHKGDFGTFSLLRLPRDSFRVTDSFPQSIISDTLIMSLWRLGLRTTTAATMVQANGGLSVLPGKREIDDNAIGLLRSFDSLRSLDHSSYGSASDAASVQILSLQKATATLILAKVRRIDSLPKGLDSTAVVIQILARGATLGSNIATLAKVTGLDTASLKALAQSLLQSGVLTASDSTSLFPPYPVRVKIKMSVGSPVTVGGPAVAVQGVFAWTKGARISSPRYSVHTSKGLDSSFQFLLKSLPQSNDTTWNLAGSFSLQAPSSAARGTDTLVVTISDDSGRAATAFAMFQVVARDTASPIALDSAAPVILAQTGTKDTVVSWATTTYPLSWSVSDDSALGPVTLNDSMLAGKDGIFQTTVTLKVGRDSFRLVAKDRHGRETRSVVVVTRRMDTTAPTIRWVNPPGDTSVPNAADRMEVEVSAFDSIGIDSVKINNVKMLAAPYKVTIPLANGANVVEAMAWDKAGNASDPISVTITRAKSLGDTVRPKIVVTAKGEVQLPYDSAQIEFAWRISDDRKLGAVRIHGELVVGVAGLYSLRVPLKVGRNSVVVIALDSAGNEAKDSTVVERDKDRVGPAITAIGCDKVCNVPFDTTGFEVSWSVVDANLANVWVDGDKINGISGIYRKRLALRGDTTLAVIKAIDSAGNETTDTLRVTKSLDTQRPVLSRQTGTGNLSVPYATSSISVAWVVTDNGTLKSVQISGVPAASADTIYKATLPLRVGKNVLWIKALDQANNLATDSVIVTRGYHDSIAPVVVANDTLTRNRTVSWFTKTFTVSWKVTDNDALASVKIGDSVVAPVAGVYQATVNLAVGANKIVVIATDSAGNQATDSTVVEREQDRVGPAITAIGCDEVCNVPFDTTGFNLAWSVVDANLANVWVDGDKIDGNSGIYRKRLALRGDTTLAVIKAIDSAGNETTDTLRVAKSLDTQRPLLSRQTGTGNLSVPYTTGSISVAWVVTDNGPLKSVQISGVSATASADTIYKATVPLRVGKNVLWIKALDQANNLATDSVIVTRGYHDSIAPVVVANDTLTRSRTVSWYTKTFTVSWKVTDNDALASVKIGDSVVAPVAGVYQATVNLAVGANKIVVIATDTANNVKGDSVTITRSITTDTLVASWDFSTTGTTVPDLTGHGFDLTQDGDGVWMRANTMEFTPSFTGKTLIKAIVWLDRYPSSKLPNGVATVVGYYEGVRLLISEFGQVEVAGQRGAEPTWNWAGLLTKAGAVPLGKWVELAVGANNQDATMGIWIDGVAQTTYASASVAGTQIRSSPSNPFYVGKDYVDGQQFAGKIQSVKVYSDYVLGAAKPTVIDPCITMLCKLADQPVASWTVTSDTATTLSSAYNGLTLTKTAVGVWNRPGPDTLLLPMLPSGQILYRAKIQLDSYPPVSTFNKLEVVMGLYEGMKMGITSRGQVMVAGQRVLNGGPENWYGVRTADKSVPLKKEVTIDAGVDQASGEFFVWIDGVRQQTWIPSAVAGQKMRVAKSAFTLGNDSGDPQKFTGKILSASVYATFVNGYGYNPEIDATISD